MDTNAFDALSATPERLDRVTRLCRAGVVRLETTPVQERELARLAGVDRARHRRADRVPRFVVAAVAGPLGGGRRDRDARIAATALRDGRVLVTDDRLLRERAAAIGVIAWSCERLLAELAHLDGGA